MKQPKDRALLIKLWEMTKYIDEGCDEGCDFSRFQRAEDMMRREVPELFEIRCNRGHLAGCSSCRRSPPHPPCFECAHGQLQAQLRILAKSVDESVELDVRRVRRAVSSKLLELAGLKR